MNLAKKKCVAIIKSGNFFSKNCKFFHTYLSRLKTEPTKWSVRPARTQPQPGHPPSLISLRSTLNGYSWRPNVSSCGQRRLWSDWADAQADLSLRWAHLPFCWLCHEAAYLLKVWIPGKQYPEGALLRAQLFQRSRWRGNSWRTW